MFIVIMYAFDNVDLSSSGDKYSVEQFESAIYSRWMFD